MRRHCLQHLVHMSERGDRHAAGFRHLCRTCSGCRSRPAQLRPPKSRPAKLQQRALHSAASKQRFTDALATWQATKGSLADQIKSQACHQQQRETQMSDLRKELGKQLQDTQQRLRAAEADAAAKQARIDALSADFNQQQGLQVGRRPC